MTAILGRAVEPARIPASVGASSRGAPHLLVINRFGASNGGDETGQVQPPTGRLARDLCAGLRSQGITCEVIADDCFGQPRSRFASHLRLAWRVFSRLFADRHQNRSTMLLVMSDPPLLLPVMAVLAALFRLPIIHWCQDIYPDVAVAQCGRWQGLVHWLTAPLRTLYRWALDRTSQVIVPGTCLKQRLRANGYRGRMQVVSNWAEADLQPAPIAARAKSEPIRILYSGHYGQAHDLTDLVGLAQLADEARLSLEIHLALSDRGQQRFRRLHPEASDLDNVSMGDQVPEAALQDHLAGFDFHAVSIKPGSEGMVFPCKALSAFRVGRPVVFFGSRDSSLASLVEHGGAGLVAEPGDLPGLMNRLSDLASDRRALIDMGIKAQAVGRSLRIDQGPLPMVSAVTQALETQPDMAVSVTPIGELSDA